MTNKFTILSFDGENYVFRKLLKISGEKHKAEIVSGCRAILHHCGNKNEIYYDTFIDCFKNVKKTNSKRCPAIALPEMFPIPDENDTRIVLHHQLSDRTFSFGRLYRFFSLEDKDLLIEKYVILNLEDGTSRIAIIKDINKDMKNVVFDIIRVNEISKLEEEYDKYGIWEGKVTDDYFTAYEYFMDVSRDYFKYNN